MALILNIDTATEAASICLAKDGEKLLLSESSEQMGHASWLHPAIQKMIKDAGYKIDDLDAIAVSSGPGSYTGIRVGMAAAKGFCFALQVPLITVNTLKLMAFSASQQIANPAIDLICPMIDARRMEVFTALYQKDMAEQMPAAAMILDYNSFSNELQSKKVFFFGSGSKKWGQISNSQHALFGDIIVNASHLGTLSYELFYNNIYSDLNLIQPVYVKDFFFDTKK
ncbi:MAG: tRNA (adenosine(37)-N6)-threonylcarbamoyltransferase complex dimerization subunit type 1 TsaB [Bacteroidetes bacterium]|nr:tRNA (adenosine(37)-N6)-threonylcarbamoyltransferase complex dimerization subunit type 1 TsaB [Bacteroidota bacterium]